MVPRSVGDADFVKRQRRDTASDARRLLMVDVGNSTVPRLVVILDATSTQPNPRKMQKRKVGKAVE